ncbi:hypothetical protein AVEN_193434-1 [Araneus ventricosus]|uniref:Uncharacterized protein n=1 Tax=Araneus ventricosus TaxID=182803 RepID=A0A4Y2G669_ARAVE|nr:hypothetical protein AVEN_193434-1 [Araneus ventricosus]
MKRRQIIPPEQYSAVSEEFSKKRRTEDESDASDLNEEVTEYSGHETILRIVWRTIQFTKRSLLGPSDLSDMLGIFCGPRWPSGNPDSKESLSERLRKPCRRQG